MRPRVLVEIDADGTVTVGAADVHGPDCEKITRDIEQALGVASSRTRTADYHRRPNTTHKQTQEAKR